MFSTLSKTEIIIFVTFVVCKCFQVGLVQNLVVWEWVKYFSKKSKVLKSFRMVTLENVTGKGENAGNHYFHFFL